jgi:cytochrome c-type biogenesis protein CcmF
MIAETGLASLWLAAAITGFQVFLVGFVLRTTAPMPDALQAVRPIAIVGGAFSALAMTCLIVSFACSDMSVRLVAENSNSAKPMLYKLAAAWGNHEGSMLLWVALLGLAGAAMAAFEHKLSARTFAATMGAQAAIALGFFAFLLFASNPFARLVPAPADGAGLNPLLQDPGLAFHPPTLYVGYVGLSVAFSFAVGALMTRDVGPGFARAMRPWVLGAWVFLTVGITAGSYWAYYELGWGGWWFWDPVENASLMPWLAATALLHSVNVLATRDGLRAWTVMLAVVAFSMSMIGTFLVRSGILTSVHAFAIDPRRGAFILGLLVLYIGAALLLFALRVGTVRLGSTFELVSREAGLVLNNLLLTVILALVLLFTLYPLIAAGFGVQLSIGKPFFDRFIGPIALVLVGAMAAGPLVRWRRDRISAVGRRLLVPSSAAIAALATVLFLASGIGNLPALGLVLAAGLMAASVAPLWGRNLRRVPLAVWGMVVAHAGIGVALAGMACDSAFTTERLAAVRPGGTVAVGPFKVTLGSIVPVVGGGWSGLEAELKADRGGVSRRLGPQLRYFTTPVTMTNESAILTVWDGQLYSVVGQPDGQGRWQLRLWWKPFVTLIWAGGIFVALGGTLALIGRLLRKTRSLSAAA